MVWAYASYGGGRVLVLVTMVVLARQLSPAEFGLVALAMVFITVLETVSDFGATATLVVTDEKDLRAQADTAWTFTVLLGVALSVLTATIAPLAATALAEPQLTPILCVLGLVFVVRSLGSAHYALAQRRLDFRSRTIAEMTDVGVRGVIGIGLAVAGFGAWSLVASYLAGAAAMTMALWILVKWRPAVRIHPALLRSQLRFGGPLTADHVLWALIWSIDRAFIGRVLGAQALGYYTIASRLPELLVAHPAAIAERVLFPAYAGLDRESMIRGYLLSTRFVLLLALPVGVGLGMLADPLVHVVFGSAWAPAVPAMQALTVYSVAAVVAVPPGTVYKALRRAGLLLWFTVPRFLALLVGLTLFTDEGIFAVAVCQAVTSVIADLFAAGVAAHILKVPLARLASAVWPGVVTAGGVTAVLWPLTIALSSPWAVISSALLVGGVVYAALAWLTARASIVALVDALRGKSPAAGREGTARPPKAASAVAER
jgi:PST family polysaccharide transporter